MLTILQLLAILAVGYLSAHFLIGRLQTRFFFTSGVEYILLGLLVGPQATGVMTGDVVAQLGPGMSLALGSIGMIAGLQIRFRDLFEIGGEFWRVAFAEFFSTFILVGGAFGALFWYVAARNMTGAEKVVAVAAGACVLAATAAVSTETGARVVSEKYGRGGRNTQLLIFASRFDTVIGIILFGLIFCLFHTGETSGIRPLTRTEWVAVSLGFGVLLGVLFHLFLGGERNTEKLLLALIGIVIFSSGAAYYLHLSPLFINLVLGVMLANTSRARSELLEVLMSIEKPLYVLLLVFAGAAWQVALGGGRWMTVAGCAVLYLVLHTAAKWGGARLAVGESDHPQPISPRIGRGMLGQGGVAVAMAVNYQQVYHSELTGVVVTCVLVSVLVNEFLSPALIRDVLSQDLESTA
jgi:Kef-type K+ transport system membrane component KefB